MFLKNKNSIFKIRRSKVTDYAALNNLQIGLIKQQSERAVISGFTLLAIYGQSDLHMDFFLHSFQLIFNRQRIDSLCIETLFQSRLALLNICHMNIKGLQYKIGLFLAKNGLNCIVITIAW